MEGETPDDQADCGHRYLRITRPELALGLSLQQIRTFVPQFLARLTVRRDSGPIDSIEALCTFVSTRSAFVAQKTLYGYLKTRMGTRYPSMFEDDVFVSSIDVAKMHIFAACLSDLSVFAVSQALHDQADAAAHADLAEVCFNSGLADNEEQARSVDAFSMAEAKAEFSRRLAFLDWFGLPPGPDIFSASPAALVRWSPIAPELKKFDREIVENSIRFTWKEIRSQLTKRIDGPSIAGDLSRRTSGGQSAPRQGTQPSPASETDSS